MTDRTTTSPSTSSPTSLAPVRLPSAAEVGDVRLVVADLDGTLLGADHRPDPSLWPLLEALDRRGITFCPASGRQHASIVDRFGAVGRSLVVVAENGAYVARGDEEISSDPLDAAVVGEAVRTLRRVEQDGTELGVVLAGRRTAYVERRDEAFVAVARTYYSRLEVVEDLLEVPGPFVKVAVFDATTAQDTAEQLAHLRATHQVVVSGAHWVDVMDRRTHKGAAVGRLQESLGIGPEQTMAFGDYLNDLQMLDAARHSFAMANAHPQVLERARWVAPANTENGVVRTVATLLGVDLPGVEPVVR